jgi:hypothetical protein
MFITTKKVNGIIDEATATVSTTLTAGEGILIEDNTIAINDAVVAKDSDIVTLSAGDGIDIADSVVKIDSTVAKKTDIVTLSAGEGILIADNTVAIDDSVVAKDSETAKLASNNTFTGTNTFNNVVRCMSSFSVDTSTSSVLSAFESAGVAVVNTFGKLNVRGGLEVIDGDTLFQDDVTINHAYDIQRDTGSTTVKVFEKLYYLNDHTVSPDWVDVGSTISTTVPYFNAGYTSETTFGNVQMCVMRYGSEFLVRLRGHVKKTDGSEFPSDAAPSVIVLPTAMSSDYRHEFSCAAKEARKRAHVIVTARDVHFQGAQSDEGITGFHLSGVEFFTN